MCLCMNVCVRAFVCVFVRVCVCMYVRVRVCSAFLHVQQQLNIVELFTSRMINKCVM